MVQFTGKKSYLDAGFPFTIYTKYRFSDIKTSLNNFCHDYHVTPSSNKRRTLSTTVRSVLLVSLNIFKAENYYCCYHSLIYFSKGEKMSKLLRLTFFKVFFLLFLNFNVILISCLTTQGKGGCKRIKTRCILCLY